ncbi:hypothetical protein F503_01395 [Ophiostoma piceae UAMH 11346]|uniref:Uncharacterized protein n=1 Tax=Ophiostoma piceae (strain UAMH 11346) TaxID=1262450 RepID=S3BY44_OPHP1|nr:hypothetical protein F503_01395 [Ophiostoma piceae UAMH 11346]
MFMGDMSALSTYCITEFGLALESHRTWLSCIAAGPIDTTQSRRLVWVWSQLVQDAIFSFPRRYIPDVRLESWAQFSRAAGRLEESSEAEPAKSAAVKVMMDGTFFAASTKRAQAVGAALQQPTAELFFSAPPIGGSLMRLAQGGPAAGGSPVSRSPRSPETPRAPISTPAILSAAGRAPVAAPWKR